MIGEYSRFAHHFPYSAPPLFTLCWYACHVWKKLLWIVFLFSFSDVNSFSSFSCISFSSPIFFLSAATIAAAIVRQAADAALANIWESLDPTSWCTSFKWVM